MNAAAQHFKDFLCGAAIIFCARENAGLTQG